MPKLLFGAVLASLFIGGQIQGVYPEDVWKAHEITFYRNEPKWCEDRHQLGLSVAQENGSNRVWSGQPMESVTVWICGPRLIKDTQ